MVQKIDHEDRPARYSSRHEVDALVVLVQSTKHAHATYTLVTRWCPRESNSRQVVRQATDA